MNTSQIQCPICNIPLVLEKDNIKWYPHCPKCGRNWCPNINLKWHKKIELQKTVNSRGEYLVCPECHWYSGIDKESEESVITQTIFIKNFSSLLKQSSEQIDIKKVKFRSTIAGEEPWYTLEERLKKYGKIRTSDLELLYDNQSITKFELKGWKNYDKNLFYFTKRAHVNIDEVRDAAESDGFVCFITLRDSTIICTRAKDIINEWNKTKTRIEIGDKIEERIFAAFNRGIMVVIAPDKQGNYRFVISREYKRKYCKYLAEFLNEILAKIKTKIQNA